MHTHKAMQTQTSISQARSAGPTHGQVTTFSYERMEMLLPLNA
jgi:hypothetical protein